MKKAIVIAGLLAAISGCASTGVHVDQRQLGQFKEGVTTEADVLAALGKPTTSMVMSGGTKTLSYVSASVQIKGATFIPIVGLFAGGSDTNTSSVIFTFDKDGKMVSYQSSQTAFETGMGGVPRAPVSAPSQN